MQRDAMTNQNGLGSSRMTWLHAVSWLCLGIAVVVAIVAIAGHWAINAEAFGAHDMGLALSLAFASSLPLIGAMWAAPVLLIVGVVALRDHRRVGWRLLLAAGLLAAPMVASMWW
jgi:hypothetical protein